MADKNASKFGEEPISLEPDKAREAKPSSVPAGRQKADEDEPVGLVEGGEDRPSAVRSLGAGAAKVSTRKEKFRRSLNLSGKGATRCRIFYSKIAVAPLEHLETQINDWLDGEDVDVKQVGHIIGNMVGKTIEPSLIVMVWY
jgi:hypothetical protein